MRQTAIGFRSQGLSLEGVLTSPQGIEGELPTLVVCHPHPVLGGDMENAVVTAICRAADIRGLATLRFNFRGVGDSEGEFSNGKGEQRDLEAALRVARRWPGLDGKRVAVAGYSFGASVVLGGLRRCGAARCLAFVAPPIAAVKDSRIASDSGPSCSRPARTTAFRPRWACRAPWTTCVSPCGSPKSRARPTTCWAARPRWANWWRRSWPRRWGWGLSDGAPLA